MLQNAYLLAKISADTAENEQHFAEILPKICQNGDASGPRSSRTGSGAPAAPRPAAARRPPAGTSLSCRRSPCIRPGTPHWVRFIGGVDPDGWVVSDETSKHFHRKSAKILTKFDKFEFHNFLQIYNNSINSMKIREIWSTLSKNSATFWQI